MKKESFGATGEDYIIFNASGKKLDLITNGKKSGELNNYGNIVINQFKTNLDIPRNTVLLNDNCDITYILTKIIPGPINNTIDLTLCSLDSPMFKYMMNNPDLPIKLIGNLGSDSIRQTCTKDYPTPPQNPYGYPRGEPGANHPYFAYFESKEYLEAQAEYEREIIKYTVVFYNFTNVNIVIGWFLVIGGEYITRMGPNQSWPEITIPANGMLKIPNEMYRSEDDGGIEPKNYELNFVDEGMRTPVINTGKLKGALVTGIDNNTLTLKKIFPVRVFNT
jgi:hypothetical protein